MKGTAVSDFIKPIGWTDKYPTHLDIFGKGGLHSVATIGDRYKITLERRSEGMLSFSQDDKGMYSLLGGIDNSNWFKIFDFKDNKLNFNILCQPNYILLGDKDGVAKPSPALIDMRLDIVDVREELSTVRRLEYQHVLIGNKSGVAKPRTNIGVENLPPLGAATLPVPDISIIPGIPTSIVSLFKTITGYAYLPNPTQPVNISSLSKNFQASNVLSWAMGGAWLPQIFVGSPGKVDPTPRETEASSALALTAVSLARAHKLLGNSSFIVSSKKVEFQWENELANLFASNPSTKPIAKLYGYQNTYEYGEDRSPDALDQPEQPRVQALDELDRGMLWNSGKKAEGEPGTYKAGTLRQAISGEDYVNTATIPAGPLVIMDPLYPSPGHKLIAPTKFNIRKGKESEFGKVRDPQSQQIPEFEVLEGEYAKFKNIGLSSTDFSAGSLLKVNEKGELEKAKPDIDFSLVGTVTGVASTLSAFKAVYETFQTAQTIFNTTQQTKDTAQDVSIAAAQAKATISTAEANAAALEATSAAVEATAAAATATGAATAAGISAGAAAVSALAAAASALLGSSKGDTGDTGPKGDKGDTGPQGPSGLSVLEGDVLKEADSLVTRIKDNPVFRGQYIGVPTTSINPDSSNILFLHTVQT